MTPVPPPPIPSLPSALLSHLGFIHLCSTGVFAPSSMSPHHRSSTLGCSAPHCWVLRSVCRCPPVLRDLSPWNELEPGGKLRPAEWRGRTGGSACSSCEIGSPAPHRGICVCNPEPADMGFAPAHPPLVCMGHPTCPGSPKGLQRQWEGASPQPLWHTSLFLKETRSLVLCIPLGGARHRGRRPPITQALQAVI